MENRVLIPGGCIAYQAEYKNQIIEEYRNNPLIEALPQILSLEESTEKLAMYSNYNSEERLLDNHYRIHLVQRLFQCFQPLMIHLDLESRISRVIYQGYLARNPFSPEFIQELHEGNKEAQGLQKELSNNSAFRTSAAGFSLIGVSGMGKTTAINKVLSLYPQVIVHKNYKGMSFSFYQVAWVKLDCPHEGSLKGLCLEFFRKIDDILGTNYFKKFGSVKKSIDNMLSHMCQISRSIGLGILVIDEIQHLNKARSGGDQKMLNFFVTLINTVGVPVVLIGTPAALSVLQSEFRQARRGSGQGDMIWDRLGNDINWELLVNALWDYQWTRQETILTDEIRNTLYEESQGIIDIFVKIYVMSQIQAISNGTETITPELIRQVAGNNFKLVKPMLNALKTGNIREIAKYEDISFSDIEFADFVGRQKSSVDLEMKVKAIKENKIKKEEKNIGSLKEESIIKLVDMNIDFNMAESIVEKLISEKGFNDINKIVLEAVRIASNKIKRETKKDIILNEKDLRFIVSEGRKENKSAYDSIKDKELIRRLEDDYPRVGVL